MGDSDLPHHNRVLLDGPTEVAAVAVVEIHTQEAVHLAGRV